MRRTLPRLSTITSSTCFGLLALFLSASTLAQDVPAHNPDGLISLRGKVLLVTSFELSIKPQGDDPFKVKLVQPFHLYAPVPGSLSHLKDTSFIGVTTVKGPNGKQVATEIHIFPEALRGIGEGSYPWNQPGSSPANRMTNGKVSLSAAPDAATQSQMSNGSVKRTGASTLVVQYQGGERTVTVPPNTPVTEIQLSSKPLIPGDEVTVFVKKGSDGLLHSSMATLERK